MRIVKTQNTTESEIVKRVCEVLRQGGLVIFPTETVYGAGVDATNPEAVEKLLSYKSRREGKPLSIAVTDEMMASEYVELNEQARALYRQFMPGPVTVVSKGKSNVAPGVESEFGTLGVRIPDYELIREIVKTFGKPMTATSANASGKKRPYSVSDLMSNLSEKQKSQIDLVVDADELPRNEPSTVIDTTLSAPVTLRSGRLAPNIETDFVLESQSEVETKEIAGRLLLKYWDEIGKSGLVIGLDGPLGAGKTVFAKGVAEFLQIDEEITSPTYSYIEEYNFKRHQTEGKFFHLDMWKVESEDEFRRLEVEKLLGPGKVVVIEWFSQVRNYFNKFLYLNRPSLIDVEMIEGVAAEKSLRKLIFHI